MFRDLKFARPVPGDRYDDRRVGIGDVTIRNVRGGVRAAALRSPGLFELLEGRRRPFRLGHERARRRSASILIFGETLPTHQQPERNIGNCASMHTPSAIFSSVRAAEREWRSNIAPVSYGTPSGFPFPAADDHDRVRAAPRFALD